MSKLVFLESSDIGVRYSAEAAKALGYEPLFLCRLDDFQADPRLQLMKYPHYDCDTRSTESVLAFLREQGVRDIAAVTSFADSRLKVACEVARALRVAGLDPSVAMLKDKGTVASLVPEVSPPSLVVSAENLPHEALSELMHEHPRLIVKPAEGAGGAGIFYLEGEEALRALPGRLTAAPRSTWIVQPVIEGPLVSAEGYVREGRPRVLGFAGRRKIGATETGAGFPIDDSLPSEIRARALEAIQALVARSGFRNGYFHIEFLCTHESCWMIDANMGRVGGGAIAEQIAIAYDLSPAHVFRHVLELSLFGMDEPHLYAESSRRSTYAILYGLEKGGQLEHIALPPQSRCFHTQIIANGARVQPMGKDDWSWIGILSGPTPETFHTIEQLRILASGEKHRPYY